jgi:biotin transport system ATP-binding protein
MLKTEDLRFSYGKGERELFGGINLCLPDGAFLGILGANGSGKSTLLDILAGLALPTKGKVTLNEGEDDLLSSAALIPENPDHFILGATPAEELSLGLGRGKKVPAKEKGSQKDILALAEKWSLSKLLNSPTENLSRGEKKRLALASALAGHPKIFLFDEPFSGLDYPGILSLLKDLTLLKKEGLSAAIVTHEPGLVGDLIDLWLLLRPGEALLIDKKETPAGRVSGRRGLPNNEEANDEREGEPEGEPDGEPEGDPEQKPDPDRESSPRWSLDPEILLRFGVRPF